MEKKFKRRDRFRGEKGYFSSYPITFNPTEKDAQKRMIQKRLIPKKK